MSANVQPDRGAIEGAKHRGVTVVWVVLAAVHFAIVVLTMTVHTSASYLQRTSVKFVFLSFVGI